MIKNSPRILFPTLLIFIALIAIVSIVVSTRQGVGLSPDSVVYIIGARNLQSGNGFSTFAQEGGYDTITHHAPFYSIILAAISEIGIDPLISSRWLNVVIYFSTLVLTSLIIHGFQQNKNNSLIWLPLSALVVVASAPGILTVHSYAWTEPLFILLCVAAIYCLGEFLNKNSWSWLFACAILIALSLLTRYAGLALLTTALLAVLIFHEEDIIRRVTKGIVIGTISIIPLAFWLYKNVQASGTATNRQFAYHPATSAHLDELISTISSWLLIPASAAFWIKILSVLAFTALLIAVGLYQRNITRQMTVDSIITNGGRRPAFINITILFIPIYVTFLFFSITFIDANTPLDQRILSPIYIPGIILLIYIIDRWFANRSFKSPLGFSVTGVLLVFSIAQIYSGALMIKNNYYQGIGFNSMVWRNSELIDEVRRISTDLTLFSNAPEAIYIHTGKAAFRLPVEFSSALQKPNPNYADEFSSLQNELITGKAVIVTFTFSWFRVPDSIDPLLHLQQLNILNQTDDGYILGGNIN